MFDEILCGASTMTDLPDEDGKETYGITSDFFEWLESEHARYVELLQIEFGDHDHHAFTPAKFHYAIYHAGKKLMMGPTALDEGVMISAVTRVVPKEFSLEECLAQFSHIYQVIQINDEEIKIRGVLK